LKGKTIKAFNVMVLPSNVLRIVTATVKIQRSYASNRQVNKAKLTPTDRNNATDEKFYQLRCFYPLGKLALFVKIFGSQNLSA
jgi:hypothetical protein